MAENFNFQIAFEFVGEGDLRRLNTILTQNIQLQRELAAAQGKTGATGRTFTATAQVMTKTGKVLTGTMKGTADAITSSSVAMRNAAAQSKAASASMVVSWQSVRRVVTGVVIARALGKVSQAITKAATDAATLQLRIEELRSIQGQATVSSNAWADALLRVSNNTGIDSIQVAEAAYQALSNQVVTAATAAEFLEGSVISLARVTASDLNTAVSGVSAILNSYSLDISHAETVSAALFATVEQGRLRLSDIADTIGNVTIVSNQLGISFQEVLGSIATLTRQGTSAANAQTFLRNAMLALIKPSKEMRKALNSLGFASGDAATKQLGLIRTLELLSNIAGEGNSELEQMAKFFGRIRGLIGATGLVADLDKTAGIIDRVSNSLQDFRDRSADVEKSTFVILQKEAVQIANAFQEWFISARNVAAALNDLPFVDISQAVKALSAVVGVVLIAALLKATLAAKALVVQMALLGGPVGAGLAIGAIIGQLGVMAQDMSVAGVSAKDLSKDITDGAKESALAWSDAARIILKDVRQAVSGTESAFAGLTSQLKDQIQELNDALDDSFSATDRRIKFEDDPVKQIRLIVDDIVGLNGLLDDALEGRFAEDAAKISERIFKLLGQLSAARKDLFQKGSPSSRADIDEAFAFSGKDVQTAQRDNLKDAAKQISIIEKTSGQHRTNARHLNNTNAKLEKLNANLAITVGKFTPITAVLEKQVALVDKSQAQVKGFVEQFRKQSEAGQNFVTDDNLGNLQGQAAFDKAANIVAGIAGKGEALKKLRADLIGIEERFIALAQTDAFSEGILDAGEVEVLKADADALFLALAALKDAGGVVDEAQFRNVTALRAALFNLSTVDFAQMQLALAKAKEISAESGKRTKEIGDITKLNAEATRGTEDQKNFVAQAVDEQQQGLQGMAAAVEAYIIQVRNLKAEVQSAQGLVAGGIIKAASGGTNRVGGGFGFNAATARRFAGGGSLAGIGLDQQTASFAPGEFISNQASSAEFLPQLIAMNSGARNQRREAGGNVSTSVGDINLTIQGGETAEATVRQIGQELQREIRRGNLRLN